MKYVETEQQPILELTERNIITLLKKLDDPLSENVLLDPSQRIYVQAIEAGPSPNFIDGPIPQVQLSRHTLGRLLSTIGHSVSILDFGHNIFIKAVEDSEHYANREPGPIFMPSSRESY